MGGLEALFAPRSVAIVGASRDPAKLGFRLLKNVKDGGFAGQVYPVNPAGAPILGLPTVSAVEALPEAIDLALVSLPAQAVPAALKALAARQTYCRVIHTSPLPAEVAAAVRSGGGPLPYDLARRLLETYGLKFCREHRAASIERAVAAAEEIGYPIVVKADVPGLTHKTDVGGVALGLRDGAAVREACRELAAQAGAQSFLVQEQISPGVELLLGGRRDEIFGPVVAVGAGGVLTEVVREASLRRAPLAEEDIEEMLDEGALPRLLAGPRGLPPVDRETLAGAVHALSHLLVSERRVLEVDINPIIAAGSDLTAVDALVIVGDRP